MLFFDRVQETTTTTGTGSLTLAGAVGGYRSFSNVLLVGDRVPYAIVGGTEWEVGEGIYSATNTLTRSTVFASSNAGGLVSFSAGTKAVWIDQPAVAATAFGEMLTRVSCGFSQ